MKIAFRGGSQGFDGVLERILVDPAEKVKQKHRDFRICQEERVDVSLAEVFSYGMIVGEIPVVDKSFIHPHEGMGSPWMPYSSFGRISLMTDPHMGVKVFELVILDNLFGVSDDLQDEHVSAVREDEGPFFSERGIEFFIQ